MAWIGAFVFGWFFPKGWLWAWIDVAYYPLAAFGVVLLFLSSDVQRERLENADVLQGHTKALTEHSLKRPSYQLRDAGVVLTAKVDYIRVITQWAESCKPGLGAGPGLYPRCSVVERIKDPVEEFLKSADAKFPNYEERLLTTCEAGSKLIDELQAPGRLPGIVMGKFIEQWNAALEKNLDPMDYAAADRYADEFVVQATKQSAQIRSAIGTINSDIGETMAKINAAEIEYASIMFSGLSQCLAAPKAALKSRKAWADEAKAIEDEVLASQEKSAKLEKILTKNARSQWVQLYLWPFVLLIALALKFGKGLASLRSSAQTPASPKHSKPRKNTISLSGLRRQGAKWRLAKRRAVGPKVRPTGLRRR